MKNYTISGILIYLSISLNAFAQLPDTDIFLVGIKQEKGKLVFGSPENITNRKGYDNQPCFSKDGKSVFFVSVIDSSQSDIYSVNTTTKKYHRLLQRRKVNIHQAIARMVWDYQSYVLTKIPVKDSTHFHLLPWSQQTI